MGMAQLVEEAADHAGAHGNSKYNSIQGTPEVGIVIDIIASAPRHIDRVTQEKDGVNDGRYLNHAENIQRVPGADHYKSKHDSADGARRAKAPVIIIVTLFEVRGDICYDEGSNIKDSEIVMLQTEYAHVIIFQRPAKEIQGEHIKGEVH